MIFYATAKYFMSTGPIVNNVYMSPQITYHPSKHLPPYILRTPTMRVQPQAYDRTVENQKALSCFSATGVVSPVSRFTDS